MVNIDKKIFYDAKSMVNIDKKTFTKYINEIKNVVEFHCEFNDFLEKYYECYVQFPPSCINETVELLGLILNDKYGWIEYYVWELDFGKKYKDGAVTENGENVKLETPDDLYDLLVRYSCE